MNEQDGNNTKLTDLRCYNLNASTVLTVEHRWTLAIDKTITITNKL